MIEGATLVAGVQRHFRKFFLSEPIHHVEHELSCDAASAVVFLRIHVEDHGATGMEFAGVSGPMANYDTAASNDLALICFREESAVRASGDCGAEIFLRSGLHDVEGASVDCAHVLIHRSAMMKDRGDIGERGEANLEVGERRSGSGHEENRTVKTARRMARQVLQTR